MRSPLRATLLFEVKWAISKPFRMVGRFVYNFRRLFWQKVNEGMDG